MKGVGWQYRRASLLLAHHSGSATHAAVAGGSGVAHGILIRGEAGLVRGHLTDRLQQVLEVQGRLKHLADVDRGGCRDPAPDAVVDAFYQESLLCVLVIISSIG